MKSKIRLILVTAILCVASSFVFGQTEVKNTFIGYWTTDGAKTRIVFFKDKEGMLQMVEWDSSDGEEMEILKIQAVNNTITTTEKMVSTNHITYNTYSVVDDNTLKRTIGGDGNGAIIYLKRLK